jgi:predicted Zn-dependent protease
MNRVHAPSARSPVAGPILSAARSASVSASVLCAALMSTLPACGADTPPAQSAAAAKAPRGARTATGAKSTSLGDSALEPEAVEAGKAEDWPRAELLYRELARRQPGNAAAKRGLGVALLNQQKNDEAATALEASLRLSDDVETRMKLAAAFAAQDRYPSALPHLRKAVAAKPKDPLPAARLAGALVKVEKPDSAADVLHESKKTCSACSDDDDWNRAAEEVGRACAARAQKQAQSGDAAGARKFVELAVRVRPELPEAQLALGQVARAEGDKTKATAAYRKAVAGLPDAKSETGALARLELATLLLAEGAGGEAVTLAEQVVAVRSDDGTALDTLGRACDATRNVKCARQAYGKVIKLPGGGADQGAFQHAKGRMKELKGRRR